MPDGRHAKTSAGRRLHQSRLWTGYPGISHTLWAETCAVLGEQVAAVCVVLIDHAMHRKDDPVRKPQAYFRTMLAKAAREELYLHRFIFSILKRVRGLCDT